MYNPLTLCPFPLILIILFLRELKMAVADLQDNVANLICAATVSDVMQEERKQCQQTISELKQVLVDVKANHEKRLRRLRQEHNRSS